MKINTISTKELRVNLPKVKKAIDNGESFVLVYRSKPFAELRPLNNKRRLSAKKEIDVTQLPFFGIWQERVKRAGGSQVFLKKLRQAAWR